MDQIFLNNFKYLLVNLYLFNYNMIPLIEKIMYCIVRSNWVVVRGWRTGVDEGQRSSFAYFLFIHTTASETRI